LAAVMAPLWSGEVLTLAVGDQVVTSRGAGILQEYDKHLAMPAYQRM